MNISKAIQHFEYKLKNVWTPTKRDKEAYNALIEFKDQQESINLTQNEALAKLWVHQLILLNQSELYSAERAIQVIDEILSKSVYEWTLRMHEQLEAMHSNVELGKQDGFKDALVNGNITVMQEIATSLEIEKGKKVKEGDLIRFVENHITRIITKF